MNESNFLCLSSATHGQADNGIKTFKVNCSPEWALLIPVPKLVNVVLSGVLLLTGYETTLRHSETWRNIAIKDDKSTEHLTKQKSNSFESLEQFEEVRGSSQQLKSKGNPIKCDFQKNVCFNRAR